jgi:hypothetical protein
MILFSFPFDSLKSLHFIYTEINYSHSNVEIGGDLGDGGGGGNVDEVKGNSILYYLRAESTAVRPITHTAHSVNVSNNTIQPSQR